MIDVGDEIPGREAGGFLQEVLCAPGTAARRHHAVAQNVLLGDNGEIRRLETALQPHDADADGVAVQQLCFRKVFDNAHRWQAVIGEHAAEALGGTFAPRRQQHALVLRLQLLHMRRGGFENVDAALRALRREVAALPAAGIGRSFGFRRLKGR